MTTISCEDDSPQYDAYYYGHIDSKMTHQAIIDALVSGLVKLYSERKDRDEIEGALDMWLEHLVHGCGTIKGDDLIDEMISEEDCDHILERFEKEISK